MGLTAAVASLAKALPLHKTGSNVHVHVIIIVVVVVVVFVVSMAASGSSVRTSVHLAGWHLFYRHFTSIFHKLQFIVV